MKIDRRLCRVVASAACVILSCASLAGAQAPAARPERDCSTPPDPPTRLTIAYNSGGVVGLTWTAAAGNPTTYFLQIGSIPAFANLADTDLNGTTTSYGTSGVAPGKYYVRIRAANACGTSEPSNEVILVVEATLSEERRARLESTLTQGMAAYLAPGAIVGMWFPQHGTWVTGSGHGEMPSGAEPSPGDYLRIGSITKTFTATVVLQLVDERKLSLDDKLSKFEPWVPGSSDITVRQLLNMTSGLVSFTALDEFWGPVFTNQQVGFTPRQLVEMAVAYPPRSGPGEVYYYCNTNYVLLGMIIESVTGATAAHEITTRIIDRLGLSHTSFPMTSVMPEPYMHGYAPGGYPPYSFLDVRDSSVFNPTQFWTAGGMISTVGDLKIWMRALANGDLLSDEMHADQLNFAAPNTSSYGLGVMNLAGAGFGHSGEVPGYNSSMYYLPGIDAISIVHINRYPSVIEGAADMINGALIRAMIDNPMPVFSFFTFPDTGDYRQLSWTDAFAAAHDKFSREYAFTEWKSIDWAALFDRFAPRIAQAQADNDAMGYYQALHEYVASIPDRHVSLGAEDESVPVALGRALAGGGFGLAVAELDDWRIVAGAVVANGPASRAGILPGAEIISWGGLAARTALDRIDVAAVPFARLSGMLGNEKAQATREHYRLEQARLLTRAAIGSTIQVVFRNPGTSANRTAILTAGDDGGATFSLLNFARQAELSDEVDYRILPEGYGYVRVRMERDMQNPGAYPARVYQRFKEAIAAFVEAGVAGVIVDLRGNFGGSDQLAADLSGFFYSDPAFYEYQEYYDKRTGDFLRLTLSETGIVDHISIEPQTPHYDGLVVALVNPTTHSSGEGPAMGISRAPKGHVVGFHGTGGSFGMVGGAISMPGGYTIEYPFGRTLDESGVIQLDSRNGIGGVAPNPRVPMTLENVLAFAAGTDVELQYAIRFLDGGGTPPQPPFVGPANGGGWSGTISGSTLTYNGVVYPIVNGRVTFPDCTMFIVAPNGALVGGATLPSCTPTSSGGGTAPNRVTPVIAWATPASIQAGTALSAQQLNATASFGGSPIAGTFVYSPPAGTVMNVAGNQTLTVSFTPTNGVAYATASGTVTLTVNGANGGGSFVGPRNGGGWTGTIVGSNVVYNGATYSIVNGRVSFPDCTMFVVAPNGALVGGSDIPNCTPGGAPAQPIGGGAFVGPAHGGGWSGTISGSTFIYNGVAYPIVNGRVSFPDCTMFIVAPNGALVGGSTIPNCTPADRR